jgi:enterochelin esterase family protein
MDEDFVWSESKSPGRRIWSAGVRTGVPAALLLFLDAELYLERVSAAQVVRQLEDEGRIPHVVSAFVSSHDRTARHADYVCDLGYSRFLSEEVVPFVGARHPEVNPERVVLIGLSLSGLAAAHAALTTGRFAAAICQSPSFWWDNERLASSLPDAGSTSAAFWVSVGDRETESEVSHPPSGLFQGPSQRDSCERGAAALRAAGYRVSHRVFQGGHDPACWRDDLALALPWAISQN